MYFYCIHDFEIKGISEAINHNIVHDESLPAKPEWRYLIYCTCLSHTKLCIGKWERRGPVRYLIYCHSDITSVLYDSYSSEMSRKLNFDLSGSVVNPKSVY